MIDVVTRDDEREDQCAVSDLAWFGIRSITSPRRMAVGPRTGEFGVGVAGRYAPRRNGDHSLICFACFID